MNKKEIKRKRIDLIRTLEVQTASYQQEEMVNFILEEVAEIAPDAVVDMDRGNIYVTKGKAKTYPCVVSHMDTVHSIYPNSRVFDYGGKLFAINRTNMKRVGTGGDDKVGVFICLEMLREFDNIKLAFFRDEEVGCIGSAEANMDFFTDVSFALQCDRKGYKDFVNRISGTKLYSKEFSEAIQDTLTTWGKMETSGGLTDVLQLAENGIGVCVANMSCGYHDPHTDNEYCVLREVLDTSDFVADLIKVLWKDGERWEMKHEKYTSYNRWGGWEDEYYNNYYGGGNSWSRNGKSKKGKGVIEGGAGTLKARWINGTEVEDDENDQDYTPKCPCCDSNFGSVYDADEKDFYCYTCRGTHEDLKMYLDDSEEDIADESTDVINLLEKGSSNKEEE